MVNKFVNQTKLSHEEEVIWKKFIEWSDNNSEINEKETSINTINITTNTANTTNKSYYSYYSYIFDNITSIYQYLFNLFWYKK